MNGAAIALSITATVLIFGGIILIFGTIAYLFEASGVVIIIGAAFLLLALILLVSLKIRLNLPQPKAGRKHRS